MKKITYFFAFVFLFNTYAQTVFAPSVDLSTTNGGAGEQPYALTSGLINNDAFPDLVFSTETDSNIQWYANDGNGNFTFGGIVELNTDLTTIYDVELVDLNSDTFLDILASGYSNGALVWYQNDGNGNFSQAQVIDNTLSGPIAIAFGQIDGDATIDVAVNAYDGGEIVWYSNDGSGNFTKSTNLIDNTLNAPGSLELVDLDGDTDLDAVVSTASFSIGSNVGEVFYNDLIPGGSVSFTKGTTSFASSLQYAFSAKSFDLDGDANLDILLSDLATSTGSGDFYWYEANGSGFDSNVFTTSVGNPSDFEYVDLDGDTFKDIVLCEGALTSGNDIVWFRNLGNGTYSSEEVIADDQGQIYAMTVDDFDGDGDIDLVTVDYNSSTLLYVENQLETLSTVEFIRNDFKIYPNPATNNLFFSSTDFTEAQILITDFSGKVVLDKALQLEEGLDVSNLTSGIYTITVNQSSNYRFVKM